MNTVETTANQPTPGVCFKCGCHATGERLFEDFLVPSTRAIAGFVAAAFGRHTLEEADLLYCLFCAKCRAPLETKKGMEFYPVPTAVVRIRQLRIDREKEEQKERDRLAREAAESAEIDAIATLFGVKSTASKPTPAKTTNSLRHQPFANLGQQIAQGRGNGHNTRAQKPASATR